MDQETAYQLALEAKRRSMDSGYRSNGIPAIDPRILEQVRRERKAAQTKEK